MIFPPDTLLPLAPPGFAQQVSGDPGTRKMQAAARGLEVTKLDRFRYIIIHKHRAILFLGSQPILVDSRYSRHNDKGETKAVLQELGVPVPHGCRFGPGSEQEIVRWLDRHGPGIWVLKPTNMNMGKGVYVDLRSRAAVLSKYRKLSAHPVVIEEHLQGDEHRFLLVGGRTVAVARRRGARVLGDGSCSVAELVAAKNALRKTSRVHRKHLIHLDAAADAVLAEQDLSRDAVPDAGRTVILRKVSNVSMGGDSEDVTADVHPGLIAAIEKIWEAFRDRAVLGIDVILPDATQPPESQRWGVIEVNNQPMSRGLHGAPTIGMGRNVDAKILDYVFPPQS